MPRCRRGSASSSASASTLGDIILDDGDIFGDGVNIVARLEALAEPGGICLGGSAHEQVRDKLDLAFEDMGEQQVKNMVG
jgi:adenylate cyclase